jgi:hypothetical protein
MGIDCWLLQAGQGDVLQALMQQQPNVVYYQQESKIMVDKNWGDFSY